ncbi:MAG TPA: hypothetical protein VM283_00335, partial [Armatimonadota bacterium]|nr:hypothetical protein [Armatimonadota bacterium]
QSVTGDSDWAQVSVSATAPDVPHYVMAYCNLKGPGKAWFDDLTMTGVPGPGLPGAGKQIDYAPRDFESLDGYEISTRGSRAVLQSREGAAHVAATAVLWDDTARYDLNLEYIDEPDGASTFTVLVNGAQVGTVVADAVHGDTDAVEEVRGLTIHDLDLQRFSRITVRAAPDQGERARVVALRLRRTGRYQGELMADLMPPDNLRIYQSTRERSHAAGMLNAYCYRFASDAMAKLRAEVDALKTADDVRAWQQSVRERLPELFGRWPDPTPLDPQVVGHIELDYCTIEKVLIQSEPGYYVPINVYIPKGKPLPAPGVCITCGHAAEGKGYHLYHEFGLGLAEKGYVACAFDPIGQGERITWFDPPEEMGRQGGPVGQHHQLLRTGYLVGRSLSGARTWDGVRVIDYMLTRPEIDPARIAVGGNSGGGQMTLLLTACHPQVACCAAAHPGGSCENTYMAGKGDIDLRIIALIPPRPCAWIVGDQSGEERGHRGRRDWNQRFYELLGAPDANEFFLVDGVHDLKQPKREAAYGWYSRWLAMDAGSTEAPLEPLPAEELWCTPEGRTELLGGETEFSINTRLMREMAPGRPAPGGGREQFVAERTAQVLGKLALDVPAQREAPYARPAGSCPAPKLSVLKFAVTSEPGIELPVLLIEPQSGATGPTIICASAAGKPSELDEGALPFALALAGHRVVAADVRGTGELDIENRSYGRTAEYDAVQWRRDGWGIACNSGGRTLDGLRAFDLIRLMDWLDARDGAPGSYVLVGEGEGGVWAMAAALADERVSGVAAVGMVASYRLLIENKWHQARGYFWVPRALEVYDLPDLPALIAPRPVALINLVDNVLHPMSAEAVGEEY